MIEFRNLHKSFGDNVVLRGVNIEVKDGETFAVLGSTGAGKSVMLRCVVGLVQPDRGSIIVDSEEVTDVPEKDFPRIRLKCGMVFQLPTLFDSMTVGENVAFGLKRHRKFKINELKDAVSENLRLVGLDPSLSRRMPGQLSFGEQKRVGLARTVALRPKYLLYDEPTTGLDPITAESINELIKELAQKLGVTSIVVTHDIRCVEVVADRVGLLYDGELIGIQEPATFLKDPSPVIQDFLYGMVTG